MLVVNQWKLHNFMFLKEQTQFTLNSDKWVYLRKITSKRQKPDTVYFFCTEQTILYKQVKPALNKNWGHLDPFPGLRGQHRMPSNTLLSISESEFGSSLIFVINNF